MTDFTFGLHTEKHVDGFSALDGTIRFYSFVQAAMLRTKASKVLDFGAGRGGGLLGESSEYKRRLMDLRSLGAQVVACDVDDVVLTHPASDQQVVIKPGEPLPFADGAFDVIVSDMTFEHIDDAAFVSGELSRILREGGVICARTPNKFGYVKLFASLTPNRMHAKALKAIQPNRRSIDVFPTRYAMNHPKDVARLFPGHHVRHYYDNGDPSYFMGSRMIYGALLTLHRVLPASLSTAVCFFIEKPKPAAKAAPQQR